MQGYTVTASRRGAHASEAQGRSVVVPLDTALDGRADALSSVELLLAAVAAALVAGAERAVEALAFQLDGMTVRVGAARGGPTQTLVVEYDLVIDSAEPDRRIAQFHERVRRAIDVTELAHAVTPLSGRVHRHPGAATAGVPQRRE